MVIIVTVARTLKTHLSACLMKNAALLVVEMNSNFVGETGGYQSFYLRGQYTHENVLYTCFIVFDTLICILIGIFYYRTMFVS